MSATQRIYYMEEGTTLRAIHTVRNAQGRYVPTGIEERISIPIVQAAIAKHEGRPDLHPTELGYSELGAGAIRKKIKAAAKKVAKSKVLKKVVKAGMGIATAVTAVVPGTQGVAAGLVVAQTAMAAAEKAKKAKNAAKSIKNAIKPAAKKPAAKKPAAPAAVARASLKLRATAKATSAVAKTRDAALLREERMDEGAKVLATLPPERQDEAAQTIANRLDSYKVVTPRGNTVWVSEDAIT